MVDIHTVVGLSGPEENIQYKTKLINIQLYCYKIL